MPSAAWCSPNPNPLPVFYRASKMSSFPFKCRIYPDSIALHKLLHKWNMSDYFYICVNIVCVHDLFFFNQNEMPRWMNEWMNVCMHEPLLLPSQNTILDFPPIKRQTQKDFLSWQREGHRRKCLCCMALRICTERKSQTCQALRVQQWLNSPNASCRVALSRSGTFSSEITFCLHSGHLQ